MKLCLAFNGEDLLPPTSGGACGGEGFSVIEYLSYGEIFQTVQIFSSNSSLKGLNQQY